MTKKIKGERAKLLTGTILGAFEGGQSDVEGLKEEINEWKDSLEGNGMEHLPKYEEVSECADALDSANDTLESLEVPECIQDIDVSYT